MLSQLLLFLRWLPLRLGLLMQGSKRADELRGSAAIMGCCCSSFSQVSVLVLLSTKPPCCLPACAEYQSLSLSLRLLLLLWLLLLFGRLLWRMPKPA